jgi:integrase/recombinase XerD
MDTQKTLTFAQAVDGFLLHKRAEALSPHTIADYANSCRHLAEFLDDEQILVTSITPRHMREFLASLEDLGLAQKTRRNIQVGLSSFWTWAMAEGYARHHVLQGIKLPKDNKSDINPFSQADLRRLLGACQETSSYQSTQHPPGTRNKRPTELRDRAIIIFLVDTGVRASELCDLCVADVDMQNQTVLIRHGKGDKSRTVHFAKRCQQALWRYHTTRQPHLAPEQPLFHVGQAEKPGPFERRVLARLLNRIGQRAGVLPANPHRFRHTFAIEFLRNGGNMFALQDILGHTNLEMVRRYLHIVQADRAHAHQVASPADNWRL